MLPIAMLTGVAVYLAFAHIAALAPLKPAVYEFDHYFAPALIFVQLLLTFCKVNTRDIRLKRWYIPLLLIQVLGSLAMYLIIKPFSDVVAQGTLVCLICPTATAAAVITAKLGGSAETIISYTVAINIVTAIFAPTVFPLIYPQPDVDFLSAFLLILSKIFPLLICPFILAQIFKWTLPRLHSWMREHASMAFYIWAVALALVTGRTVKSIVDDQGHMMQIIWLAAAGLVVCVAQFYLGKRIGGAHSERISGGQALGQKNTVFAIWMAYTYLSPVSSVAPGAYVLWQNIINSWQLWKQTHKR